MHFLEELTLPSFMVAVFCSLGGVSFGIDFGYWSGVLGMDQFAKDFGIHHESSDSYSIPSSWKSAGSGLPTAGLAVGPMLSGILGRRLGRIRALQVSYVAAVIRIIIQSAAMHSFWQLTIGRLITSIALGILANTDPVYLAEVSPISIRGTLVNFYQFSIGVGAVLVGTCNWGLYERTDQWAYRIVIILQALLPCIFLPGSFFIPESPRWLLGKGRLDEARAELKRLRPKTDQHLIDQEIDLIAAAEEENNSQQTNLRRTLIVIGVQCLQQAQGSTFMGQYSIVFFQAVGFQDVYKMNLLIGLCMAGASAFAFYLPDRFGRRWMMIISALVMCAAMCTTAGITSSGLASNKSALQGALAVMFIWQIFTSIGWSSCVWIITAELPTLQLREKSIAVGTFAGFCVSILISFISPYIQDKGYGGLEGRIGFLYGGISLGAAAWALFFLPETGFRGLEELDELFQNDVSVWNFRKYRTTGYGAQLYVITGEHDQNVSKKETDLENKAE